MVASLGKAESCHQQKGTWAVTQQVGKLTKRTGKPLKVTRTQMWVDLVGTDVDQAKTDGKPNTHLMELRQELREEQKFTPMKRNTPAVKTTKVSKETQAVHLNDYMLPQEVCRGKNALPLNRIKAEEPIYRGQAGTRGCM